MSRLLRSKRGTGDDAFHATSGHSPVASSDQQSTPYEHSSETGDFPRWTFDDAEPAAKGQDLHDWLKSIGLTSQEDYLVNPAVKTIRMGLGWDSDVDVDSSVAMFDEHGRTVDLVWHRKLRSTCGSVVHSGDSLTGGGDGDDELISVNLADLPSHVDYLLFTVCVPGLGHSFAQVGSAYVRMFHDGENCPNHELCRYSLSAMSGNAMLMGLLTRKGAYWNFKALGTPATGRRIEDLVQEPANLSCLAESPSHKPERRYVSVSVIGGRNLAAKDSPGLLRKTASSDPYFVVEFESKKYTSEHRDCTLEPQWKSPPFQVGWITETEEAALRVQVFDYDLLSADDFMGMVKIPGYAMFKWGEGEHTFWFELNASDEMAYRKESVSGEILINFSIEVSDNGSKSF